MKFKITLGPQVVRVSAKRVTPKKFYIYLSCVTDENARTYFTHIRDTVKKDELTIKECREAILKFIENALEGFKTFADYCGDNGLGIRDPDSMKKYREAIACRDKVWNLRLQAADMEEAVKELGAENVKARV